MTTYKVGSLMLNPDSSDVVMMDTDGLLFLNTGATSMRCDVRRMSIGNSTWIPGNIDALIGKRCLYDPSAGNAGPYLQYAGRLYLLPVSKELLANDTVETDGNTVLLNVLVITGSDSGHIWDGNYSIRKFQYYVASDMPLAVVQALAVKACGGEDTRDSRICNLSFDRIPKGPIKGSDLKGYGIPWYQTNGGFPNEGRLVDWNRTFSGNGILKGESICCQLSQPGNRLAAYGGAEKPDWKALGVDALLDVLLD